MLFFVRARKRGKEGTDRWTPSRYKKHHGGSQLRATSETTLTNQPHTQTVDKAAIFSIVGVGRGAASTAANYVFFSSTMSEAKRFASLCRKVRGVSGGKRPSDAGEFYVVDKLHELFAEEDEDVIKRALNNTTGSTGLGAFHRLCDALGKPRKMNWDDGGKMALVYFLANGADPSVHVGKGAERMDAKERRQQEKFRGKTCFDLCHDSEVRQILSKWVAIGMEGGNDVETEKADILRELALPILKRRVAEITDDSRFLNSYGVDGDEELNSSVISDELKEYNSLQRRRTWNLSSKIFSDKETKNDASGQYFMHAVILRELLNDSMGKQLRDEAKHGKYKSLKQLFSEWEGESEEIERRISLLKKLKVHIDQDGWGAAWKGRALTSLRYPASKSCRDGQWLLSDFIDRKPQKESAHGRSFTSLLSLGGSSGHNPRTALQKALEKKHDDVAKLLLAYGARPDLIDDEDLKAKANSMALTVSKKESSQGDVVHVVASPSTPSSDFSNVSRANDSTRPPPSRQRPTHRPPVFIDEFATSAQDDGEGFVGGDVETKEDDEVSKRVSLSTDVPTAVVIDESAKAASNLKFAKKVWVNADGKKMMMPPGGVCARGGGDTCLVM